MMPVQAAPVDWQRSMPSFVI